MPSQLLEERAVHQQLGVDVGRGLVPPAHVVPRRRDADLRLRAAPRRHPHVDHQSAHGEEGRNSTHFIVET